MTPMRDPAPLAAVQPWPDMTKPGAPLEPEAQRVHWLSPIAGNDPQLFHWLGDDWHCLEFGNEGIIRMSIILRLYRYGGPVYTSADLATARAQAEAAGAEMMREAAANYHDWKSEEAQKLPCNELSATLHDLHARNIRALPLPSGALALVVGLPEAQEPKYTVNGHAIVNRASGEEIPADEPVFIFRARDMYAANNIRLYAGLFPRESSHYAAVIGRIEDFLRFAQQHPERMKEPDTAIRARGDGSNGDAG